MNILDLQFEFQMQIENIGDNETDLNLVTIQHFPFDAYGGDIPVQETYRMKEDALRQMAIGLEAMAKKIRDYL